MAYHKYKNKSGGYYRHRNRGGKYSTTPGCLVSLLSLAASILAVTAAVISIF